MIKINNSHEKLINSIQSLLTDVRFGLPFYGEFCLHISYHPQESIGTCGVNVKTNGFNYYYSPSFLDRLTQKEVNFINIHEIFHLIFDHPRRTSSGQYNHRLANIAQDMIINHIIWGDINHNYIEIPKDETGKNMALFVPKEYNGKLIFEELYAWLQEEKESREKNKQNQSEKNRESDYGPHGKNPSNNSKDGNIDTYSLDKIFDDILNGSGEYLDKHISDDVPEQLRKTMACDLIEKLRARGLTKSNTIEETLGKLVKKRKDYLREIKRTISNHIMGTIKNKTILRPNRRGISGLKGVKKTSTEITAIIDVSGSMFSFATFEKILSYIYRSDIILNIIQADTEITSINKKMTAKDLQKMKINGGGGTVLNPSVQWFCENMNKTPLLIITDGLCDIISLKNVKHNVLIISIDTEVTLSSTNGKTKQLIVDPNES